MTCQFFATLLLGLGFNIYSLGRFVFLVSLLPVFPLLFVCIAHPTILIMFGIVLCKCSGNVLIGYVIFKLK